MSLNPDKNLSFKMRNARRDKKRELRIEIFNETIEAVKHGGYLLDGQVVHIDNSNLTENTVFFEKVPENEKEGKERTEFAVINGDCLEVTELLVKSGLNPAVLNMASSKNPGGGVMRGSGAQEENLFRRTNLFLSLYQFAPYANQYGIKKDEKQYPIPQYGGIYSQNITVFRSSEFAGYEFLKNPFKISVITVAALNRPKLEEKRVGLRLSEHQIPVEKEKIRLILRIGSRFGHHSLVLSAFGCGAFKTPPEHMAELFKEVFEEKEFKGVFKLIVFAIIDDYNSRKSHNPEGNYYPFFKVFNGM